MKKDLATHFTFMIALFALTTLVNQLFSLNILVAFWVGGMLGTILPDIDHLIYVYLLHPSNSSSAQISTLIQNREYVKTWDTLVATRFQRNDLLFHTASFQVVFLVFAFLIVSSSNSFLGKGIVLAFSLHLIIDSAVDLMEKKNIDGWFIKFPLKLSTDQKKWFLGLNAFLVLILGFLV